ncbi:hypothetical protein J2S57_006089 [Kineosporia succinea]|uniref:Uncharacterized protein n=1 Tax=Kineosporia succinea TaxID=84632 RepID=A0ABT9PDV0_9ACTN|nr:hypothetical protein [Kineosporia succinea]
MPAASDDGPDPFSPAMEAEVSRRVLGDRHPGHPGTVLEIPDGPETRS